MNALGKSLPAIFAALCFNACADRNSEEDHGARKDGTPVALQNPGDLEPKVLDFSRFETEDFSSISWEKKCEGIGQFIREFSAAYLENGVDVSYDVSDCTLSTYKAEFINFWPKIKLTKDGLPLSLIAIVDASFDRPLYQLSVNRLDLLRSEKSTARFNFEKEDEPFGTNLIHLETTVRAWLQHQSSAMVNVFGIPYTNFVKDAETKYGPDSTGLKVEDSNPMTIQLLPLEQTVGTGTVKFLSVDPSVFLYTDLDGKEASRLFLGCADITCLNNSGIGYDFLGNSLVVTTPAVVEVGKSTTHIFKATFESWE
ncbi:MAG: hypothetical protein M3Q07_15325 [Pseudobdellovibrionaceae bacterium]|nr:hypothetical protein [Pseudobdellovibrionaceae bacterium]